ncbi:sensor histidine kinase [Lyngbya aestuarii]|uniref:sensor histidine kinase n=1 Tax=Lyngbya aestuarii TaxID=118322 RepID=UPI000689ACBF|nr:histidine kinase dimerization/phosphoacceptor domain -containing protein [Lyngbya aestuarii]
MSLDLTTLFASIGFIPHGHCYLWKSNLVTLHIASDSLIALSYYALPISLFYFVRKRVDLPYPWIFILFAGFIISCGTTHLMGIWTLWHPDYWVSGWIKLITAVVSCYTAIELVPLVPQALALKSPTQLEEANQKLQQEIAERLKVEIALRQSEQRYRAIIEDQTELIARFQPDETITFVNKAYCRYFKKPLEEIINHSYQPIIFPEDQEKVDRCVELLSLENPVGMVEHRVIVEDEVRWMQWINRAIFNDAEQIVEYQSVGRDISDSKKVEKLKQQETLLKEIHHRVKNNLQVICSLLRLQSRCVQDPVIKAKFIDSQNRVKSMALIHEKLYQSDNFRRIRFDDYIQDLTKTLLRTYTVKTSHISLEIDIDQYIFLDFDILTPCGLIICELISNSLKYAFEPNTSGKIWIQATLDNKQYLILTIGDNGQGLPSNLNLDHVNTLGLQLVQDLTEQLQGKLTINQDNGTEFKIELYKISSKM